MPSQIPFEGDDEATTLASTTAAPLVVKRGPILSNDAVLDASVDSAGSGTGTEVGMKRNESTGSGSLTFLSGNQYVGSVKQGVLVASRDIVVSHQEYGHAQPSAHLKASLGAKYIPSAGMMEGVGTYTWVSNDVHFKGEFKGNALRGNGRYEWNADGVVYDGELWLFGIRVKACDSRLDMLLHCRRRCSRRVERGPRISSCH